MGMKRGLAYLTLVCVFSWLFIGACSGNEGVMNKENNWVAMRAAMVKKLSSYGIKDEGVLKAMGTIRRHRFIPEKYRDAVPPYGDHPCPIGFNQTISQPYIVAYMTEKLHIQPGQKVLEIGTGSGYQAAVLAELGAEVYSIEIIPELADHARKVLALEGYTHIKVLTGDGFNGWPEYSPFDAIIVTCAPDDIPQALVKQLKEGGKMILPVGTAMQRLVFLRKKSGRIEQVEDLPVRFVPMVHE
ncbi:MAG: protein-L-isoaspartate(D-aspartate) O-methyltransferase [bacterium]